MHCRTESPVHGNDNERPENRSLQHSCELGVITSFTVLESHFPVTRPNSWASSSARTTICVEAPPRGVEANRRSKSVIGSPVRGASMGRSRPRVRSPYSCDWKQFHRRLDEVRVTRLRVTAAQTRSGAALAPEQLSRPTAASGTRRWQRRLGPWLGLTRPGGNDRGGGDFWGGAPGGDGPPTQKKNKQSVGGA